MKHVYLKAIVDEDNLENYFLNFFSTKNNVLDKHFGGGLLLAQQLLAPVHNCQKDSNAEDIVTNPFPPPIKQTHRVGYYKTKTKS